MEENFPLSQNPAQPATSGGKWKLQTSARSSGTLDSGSLLVTSRVCLGRCGGLNVKEFYARDFFSEDVFLQFFVILLGELFHPETIEGESFMLS